MDDRSGSEADIQTEILPAVTGQRRTVAIRIASATLPQPGRRGGVEHHQQLQVERAPVHGQPPGRQGGWPDRTRGHRPANPFHTRLACPRLALYGDGRALAAARPAAVQPGCTAPLIGRHGPSPPVLAPGCTQAQAAMAVPHPMVPSLPRPCCCAPGGLAMLPLLPPARHRRSGKARVSRMRSTPPKS